jgi:hypothetical protein
MFKVPLSFLLKSDKLLLRNHIGSYRSKDLPDIGKFVRILILIVYHNPIKIHYRWGVQTQEIILSKIGKVIGDARSLDRPREHARR